MKQAALAAALCLAATLAPAQAPEAPKAPAPEAIRHKCDPKPEYPGRIALQSERGRSQLQKAVKAYEECMKAFIEERKAVITANQTAANAAIAEFNATIAAIAAAQKEANE